MFGKKSQTQKFLIQGTDEKKKTTTFFFRDKIRRERENNVQTSSTILRVCRKTYYRSAYDYSLVKCSNNRNCNYISI